MVQEKKTKERKFFVKASGKKVYVYIRISVCARQQVVPTLDGSHRFQKHLR